MYHTHLLRPLALVPTVLTFGIVGLGITKPRGFFYWDQNFHDM